MNAITAYCDQLQWGHTYLDMVTADVTPEQAHWLPPGIANPLAAVWAHAVMGEDAIVQSAIRGRAPLCASAWATKVGASVSMMGLDLEQARLLRLDLPAFRQYAQAVYAETDSYVASLTEADLDSQLDLSRVGFGQKSLGWALNVLVISHINNMIGEISCLKGLQGAKGYPF